MPMLPPAVILFAVILVVLLELLAIFKPLLAASVPTLMVPPFTKRSVSLAVTLLALIVPLLMVTLSPAVMVTSPAAEMVPSLTTSLVD